MATEIQVSRLHDLSADGDDISSLAWSRSSKYLSVGTRRGAVQLWDIENEKKLREIPGHWGRVGVLRWSPSLLASGSRDTHIRLNDIRSPCNPAQELSKHISEVCGMEVCQLPAPALVAHLIHHQHVVYIESMADTACCSGHLIADCWHLVAMTTRLMFGTCVAQVCLNGA